MSELDDRFGMSESAFDAARRSHGVDNPTLRSGMYVPTRREVMQQPAAWLSPVLIDWLWECPTELIPSNTQITEVKALLLARSDANAPAIAALVAECDDFLSI